MIPLQLVENALDAGTTQLTLSIASDLETIVVRDNGHGMPAQGLSLVGSVHATSKIRSFDQLYSAIPEQSHFWPSSTGQQSDSQQSDQRRNTGELGKEAGLKTLGFRGEALYLIADCAHEMTITSKIAGEVVGHSISWRGGKRGSIVPVAATTGTSVKVTGLFSRRPVRYKRLQWNLSQQFAKIHRFLLSCCLRNPALRVLCDRPMFRKTSSNSFGEGLQSLFGSAAAKSLLEFKFSTTWKELTDSFSQEMVQLTFFFQPFHRPALYFRPKGPQLTLISTSRGFGRHWTQTFQFLVYPALPTTTETFCS